MPRKKERNVSIKTDPLYTSDDFRMYCFKVVPCSRHYTHDWTECPFAHPGEKATRRDPRLYTYVGIECPHVKGESNKCPRGDRCPFAHSVFECWLHPSRYRTQMCNEPATCRRKICFFAHSMQEMREPTSASKDMTIGLKQGPRRVTTTSPETRSNVKPRPHFDSKQYIDVKTAAAKNRASFDDARKPPPSVELPPRPSLDSSASRLSRQTSPTFQKLSPRFEQPNAQLLNLIALLQQQQQQQQQMQLKTDSFDLNAALTQLSLNTMQPTCMQQGYDLSSMNVVTGQSDDLNNVLRMYLHQQSLNSGNNVPMNTTLGFPFNGSCPTNYSTLPSMSNQVLLQQFQQLQSPHGLRSAGLRASLDSTISNGSGRIPARVSFDGVTSVAPSVLSSQAFNYLNMTNLGTGWMGNMGADLTSDPIVNGPSRSSTESSATDSFGFLSGEHAGPYVPRQDLSTDLVSPVMDDFISFDQGAESFTRANMTTSVDGSSPP